MLEMNKKVSVVIPIYNAELFIKECVDSILHQTYINFELILVNDGSTDNSLNIIKQLSILDDRIVIADQINQGVSAARNLGISKANGDFICFVDADDYVEPDFLNHMLDQIGDNDAIFEGFKILYSNGNQIDKYLRLPSGEYASNQILDKIIDDGTLSGILLGSACGALYKLSIIEEKNVCFKSELKVNEDGVFNIDFIKASSKFVISSHLDYIYRQWKTVNKVSLDLDSTNLKNATKVIEEKYSQFPNFAEQIGARKVSVSFWTCIKVKNAKENVFYCAKFIKNSDISTTIKANYKFIKKEKINKYKLCLIWLLKHKLNFVFAFCLKVIVPHFIDRVRH